METKKIEVVCDKKCSKCKLYDSGTGYSVCRLKPLKSIYEGDTIKIEIIRAGK